MIEPVLSVVQRLMLQGGTVLLVGATAWLVLMPRALREGYATTARRSRDGTVAARKIEGRVHRIALRAALVVLLGWILRLPVQLMGFRDPFAPLADDLRILLLETVWGTVWIAQGIILLFLLTALFAVRALKALSDGAPPTSPTRASPGPGSAATAPLVVATALLVFSLALSSHALAAANPRIAVAADALHVTSAGIWIGLLSTILLVARGAGEAGEDAFILQIRRFSVTALVAVPLLVIAGVILGQYHLTTWADLWETAYGRILAAKIALAGTAMLIGFINWRTGVPRLDDAGVRSVLRRRASIEVTLVIGVLILTAILTGTARPTDAI